MRMAENELRYPLGESLPSAEEVIHLHPDVCWVRMPLPFSLDHINLWLLKDVVDGQVGWTVVDCGIYHPVVQAIWEKIFKYHLNGLPVLRVIVTHMHPDHMGLACWMTQHWGVPLVTSLGEYSMAHVFSSGSTGVGGDQAAKHFMSHGLVNMDDLLKIKERSGYYRQYVPQVPKHYQRLMDGDILSIGPRAWRVIIGYGHSPEHISLYSEELSILISGDMVLPRISTNISVFDIEPEANPLPLYLASLDKYSDLPKDTLVLPSHGRPFIGLHTRIRQQYTHHQDQLDKVLNACDEWQSAADLIPILFKRSLDLHQLTFAIGEAIAHLHALYFSGKLYRQYCEDGVFRFKVKESLV